MYGSSQSDPVLLENVHFSDEELTFLALSADTSRPLDPNSEPWIIASDYQVSPATTKGPPFRHE